MNATSKPFPARALPKTLAGWIRASVADAKMLSKHRGFKLHMGYFNEIIQIGLKQAEVCAVCLGGACIVGRGMVPPGSLFNGNKQAETIADALDDLRHGDVRWCAQNLFDARLIGWMPTDNAIERAEALIRKDYNSYKNHGKSRASWKAYLAAADIVRHKPKTNTDRDEFTQYLAVL